MRKGQGAVELTAGMGAVVIVFLAVYLLLISLPVPNFEAVAMPQVQIPDVFSHASDRHSDVVSAAVSCFSGNGTINATSAHRTADEHDAWLCQMNGKMYIWIVDKFGNTVTQFQNKAKTFQDALEYLAKQGYVVP